MWILRLLVLISLLPDSHQGDCSDRCDWLGWKPWSSCSDTCGGGHRRRYRSLCCRKENGKVIDYFLCLKECGKNEKDNHEYTFCNTVCHNRGNFQFYHFDINTYTNSYGHCICSQKYGGACCDIRKYT